jgi:hypothetical protein
MKAYEVKLKLNTRNEDWKRFGTAREAVKYILAERHAEGFTVDGRTYEDKFEEIEWIGKGRVVNV